MPKRSAPHSYWTHSDPTPTEATEGQRECARGDWCAHREARDNGDGTVTIRPAASVRAFCDRDEALIAEYLADMPRLYDDLTAELAEKPASPFEPIPITAAEAGLPVNMIVDALMRTMADILISWHERVAAVASLDQPKVRCPGRNVYDGREPVHLAAGVLAAHVSALLALQPEEMLRRMTVAAAARLAADQDYALAEDPDLTPWLGGLVRPYADYAEVRLPREGTDAGLEVIDLRGRARFLLGETKPKPDELLGVRCWECGRMALYRADQAAYGKTDDYSACGYCGHRMDRATYFGWVRQWYAYEKARMKSRQAPVLENLPGAA